MVNELGKKSGDSAERGMGFGVDGWWRRRQWHGRRHTFDALDWLVIFIGSIDEIGHLGDILGDGFRSDRGKRGRRVA